VNEPLRRKLLVSVGIIAAIMVICTAFLLLVRRPLFSRLEWSESGPRWKRTAIVDRHDTWIYVDLPRNQAIMIVTAGQHPSHEAQFFADQAVLFSGTPMACMAQPSRDTLTIVLSNGDRESFPIIRGWARRLYGRRMELYERDLLRDLASLYEGPSGERLSGFVSR
jgi:hypothetical protein